MGCHPSAHPNLSSLKCVHLACFRVLFTSLLSSSLLWWSHPLIPTTSALINDPRAVLVLPPIQSSREQLSLQPLAADCPTGTSTPHVHSLTLYFPPTLLRPYSLALLPQWCGVGFGRGKRRYRIALLKRKWGSTNLQLRGRGLARGGRDQLSEMMLCDSVSLLAYILGLVPGLERDARKLE